MGKVPGSQGGGSQTSGVIFTLWMNNGLAFFQKGREGGSNHRAVIRPKRTTSNNVFGHGKHEMLRKTPEPRRVLLVVEKWAQASHAQARAAVDRDGLATVEKHSDGPTAHAAPRPDDQHQCCEAGSLPLGSVPQACGDSMPDLGSMPSLGPPLLGAASDGAVDARALSFLPAQAVTARKREQKEKGRGRRRGRREGEGEKGRRRKRRRRRRRRRRIRIRIRRRPDKSDHLTSVQNGCSQNNELPASSDEQTLLQVLYFPSRDQCRSRKKRREPKAA